MTQCWNHILNCFPLSAAEDEVRFLRNVGKDLSIETLMSEKIWICERSVPFPLCFLTVPFHFLYWNFWCIVTLCLLPFLRFQISSWKLWILYYGIFSYPDVCWPGDRGNDELRIHNKDIPRNRNVRQRLQWKIWQRDKPFIQNFSTINALLQTCFWSDDAGKMFHCIKLCLNGYWAWND